MILSTVALGTISIETTGCELSAHPIGRPSEDIRQIVPRFVAGTILELFKRTGMYVLGV